MKVENGIIVEATRAELYGVYLEKGCDDFMEFGEFLDSCRAGGTVVVEKGGNYGKTN